VTRALAGHPAVSTRPNIAFLIAGACARRKNAAHSDHCIGYKEARHECSTP